MATSTNQLKYTDFEQNLVAKGFVLKFESIPTGKSVWFKGRITQFSDKFESDWTDEKVYGRSDPISNFKSTSRQINLSWEVVASSIEEAKENMSKCSLLFNMLYPVYSNNKGGSAAITASPLFKVSFCNLIQSVFGGAGLVCKLNGLAYDPVLEEGLFDEFNALYPQTVKFSTVLTVFHIHPLGWGTDGQVRWGKFPYGSSIKINELANVGDKPTVSVSQASTKEASKNHKEAMQNIVLGTGKK